MRPPKENVERNPGQCNICLGPCLLSFQESKELHYRCRTVFRAVTFCETFCQSLHCFFCVPPFCPFALFSGKIYLIMIESNVFMDVLSVKLMENCCKLI